MVHPMLDVARDDDGVSTISVTVQDQRAWTQVEIDFCDAAAAAALEADALAAVADVHLIVDDFQRSVTRMVALGGHRPDLGMVGSRALRVPRRHRVRPHRPRLVVRDGTPSSDGSAPATRSIRRPPIRPRQWFRRRVAQRGRVDDPPRRSRRTSWRPRRELEHRFVGLLASGAYRQSVLSIPTVGDGTRCARTRRRRRREPRPDDRSATRSRRAYATSCSSSTPIGWRTS